MRRRSTEQDGTLSLLHLHLQSLLWWEKIKVWKSKRQKKRTKISEMTITVFKMSCFSSLWIQCADKTVSRACSRPLLMLHGVFITVCSLTSKLDGGPLADHGAIRVGGHTGVLSFVLVPDGVADHQVAIHHTVMVWFCYQINFDVIFQPTATEITGVKS